MGGLLTNSHSAWRDTDDLDAAFFYVGFRIGDWEKEYKPRRASGREIAGKTEIRIQLSISKAFCIIIDIPSSDHHHTLNPL